MRSLNNFSLSNYPSIFESMNEFHLRSIILAILMCLTSCVGFSQHSHTLNFSTDSFSLNSAHEQILSAFLDSLSIESGEYRYEIIGHTDNVGNKGYNDTLSNKRAHSVYDFLATKSIDANDVFVDFKGFDMPKSSNESEKGKALNRRVELRVQKWDDFLYSNLKAQIPARHITFDTKIGLGNDSIISVCENAFVDGNGEPVDGKIDIFYQEYRTIADFIGLNKALSFVQNDNVHFYQSGGMYLLKAKHDGKPVYLKKECLKVNFSPNDSLPYKLYTFDFKEKWTQIPTSNSIESIEKESQVNNDEQSQKNPTLEQASSTSKCDLSCPELVQYLSEIYARSEKINHIAFSHHLTLEQRFNDPNYQGGIHYSTLKDYLSNDSVFNVFVQPIKTKRKRYYFNVLVNGSFNQQITPSSRYTLFTNDLSFKQNAAKSYSNFRIKHDNNGYKLVLKDTIQFTEIPIAFCDVNKVLWKKLSKRKHRAILSNYEQELHLAEVNFKNAARQNDSIPCILNMLNTFVTESAIDLTSEDWKDLFEYNKESYTKILKPHYDGKDTLCKGTSSPPTGFLNEIETVKRLAQSSNLGLYNYDIEHKLIQESHIVVNSILGENNNPIKIKETLLHSSTNNLLIKVNPYDFWTQPNSANCLILFDVMGNVFIVSNSSLLERPSNLLARQIGDVKIDLSDLQTEINLALEE